MTVSGYYLLRRGIHPVHVAAPPSISELFSTASTLSRSLGLAKPGDLIVITSGIPIGEMGNTNLLNVKTISKAVA